MIENNTRYKTGKSPMFFWLSIGIGFAMGVIQIATGQSIVSALLLALFVGLLTHGLFIGISSGVYYEITKTDLKYTMFGRTRSIPLSRIRIIQDSDIPMSGNHPGFANNGLLIHHGQGGLVYISPKQKETFVKSLLEAQDKIVYKR